MVNNRKGRLCYLLRITEIRSLLTQREVHHQDGSQATEVILDSPMQNKKIQLWALSIAG